MAVARGALITSRVHRVGLIYRYRIELYRNGDYSISYMAMLKGIRHLFD